jgi:hypothetical protein
MPLNRYAVFQTWQSGLFDVKRLPLMDLGRSFCVLAIHADILFWCRQNSMGLSME